MLQLILVFNDVVREKLVQHRDVFGTGIFCLSGSRQRCWLQQTLSRYWKTLPAQEWRSWYWRCVRSQCVSCCTAQKPHLQVYHCLIWGGKRKIY